MGIMNISEIIATPHTIKSQTSKQTTIVIKTADRYSAREEQKTFFNTRNIPFKQTLIPGSSFEGLQAQIDQHTIRIVFKPLKVSGANQTTIAESAQAVYAAVSHHSKADIVARLEEQDFRAFESYYDVDSPLEHINTLTKDWVNSSIVIANKLATFLPTRDYVFHRGSRSVKQIESEFQRTNRKLESIDKFTNINKWSPADIYVIDRSFNIDFSKAQTINSLNDRLLELYGDRRLIGVSLKKVEGNIATIDVFNVHRTVSECRYVKCAIRAKNKSIFDSKQCSIYIEMGPTEYKIDMRTFHVEAGWSCEVRGYPANLGKIGQDAINRSLVKHNAIPMISLKELKADLYNPDPLKRLQILQQMWGMITAIKPNIDINRSRFITKACEMPNDWIMSKYLGVNLLFLVITAGNRDTICDEIIRTALSTTHLSAPFIKVH